jgi:hypothetical protein
MALKTPNLVVILNGKELSVPFKHSFLGTLMPDPKMASPNQIKMYMKNDCTLTVKMMYHFTKNTLSTPLEISPLCYKIVMVLHEKATQSDNTVNNMLVAGTTNSATIQTYQQQPPYHQLSTF